MVEQVSLYIACYNAKDYIARCLEGVLKQTYPIDEILIIDDGPGDDAIKIAQNYPVTVIRRAERLGLPSARNAAFGRARNDLVAALDADCVAEPQWLENLAKNITHDKIAGAGGRSVEMYANTLADSWRSAHMGQHWGTEKIINPPFLFGNNTLFKKSAILRAGGFDEKRYRRCYEDVDISKRLKSAKYTLIYEPAAVIYHIRKDNILSLSKTYWNWDFTGRAGITPPESFINLFTRLRDKTLYLAKLSIKDLLKGKIDFVLLNIFILAHHLFSDLRHYLILLLSSARRA